MAQKIFGLGMGGSGIVVVLIIAGIILTLTNVSQVFGGLAIAAGIFIGIILGFLGIVGVSKRVLG